MVDFPEQVRDCFRDLTIGITAWNRKFTSAIRIAECSTAKELPHRASDLIVVDDDEAPGT